MTYNNDRDDEKRIMNIFNIKKTSDIPSVDNTNLDHYFKFLNKNLRFPIKGIFTQETAPLHNESKSIVLHKLSVGCNNYDDFYGLLAEGKTGNKNAVVSLAEFEVEDGNTPNFQLIDDYKTWFENYR